jgi:hypothetical protein
MWESETRVEARLNYSKKRLSESCRSYAMLGRLTSELTQWEVLRLRIETLVSVGLFQGHTFSARPGEFNNRPVKRDD